MSASNPNACESVAYRVVDLEDELPVHASHDDGQCSVQNCEDRIIDCIETDVQYLE